MKTALILAAGLATLQLSAAEVDWSKLPPASANTGVTFDTDIAPILKATCVRCHGGERPRAQLRLDTLEGVLKGAKQGPVLKVGDSANSLLVKAISQLDPETAMPPKRGPRPPRAMGTNAPAIPPPGGEGGPQDTNGMPMRPRPQFGPPPKPLTAEQVGLIRAWIDQGAK
jgi:hypothetical protein